MAQITGVAHVELSVSDLDASSAWYGALLGAPEVFRIEDTAAELIACALRDPESGMVIAFTQHLRHEPGPFTPRRAGLDHLAFAVATAAGIQEWADRLDSFAIPRSQIQDYGYGLAVTCLDPDGIALEFMWSRR